MQIAGHAEPEGSLPRPQLEPFLERTGPAESALDQYLNQIGQVDLLTREQEVELAARMKKGDPAARELLINANLRLVVKIAREYQDYGLPLLDLISEGNIGLMKAVERFDPTKGGKLSTYSSFWIKQRIKRALANQSKTIRIPVHLVLKISQLRKAETRLQEELGRQPTDGELSAELGISELRIRQMRMASARPSSLDAPVGDEEGSDSFGEIVADEGARTPYEQLTDASLKKMLLQFIDHLKDREAVILRFRFGLDGGRERTLDEVADNFGISRERVRQIQNAALKKLRRFIESERAPVGC